MDNGDKSSRKEESQSNYNEPPKEGYHYARRFRLMLGWPIPIWVAIAGLTILSFAIGSDFSWIMLCFLIAYSIFAPAIIASLKKNVRKDLLEFATIYSNAQHMMLYEINVPYAILDENGRNLWMNKMMLEITEQTKDFNRNIATIFEDVTPNLFPAAGGLKKMQLKYKGRVYRAEIENIVVGGNLPDVSDIKGKKRISSPKCSFITLILYDITAEKHYIQDILDSQLAMAVIDIDNYEDSIDNISDMNQSYVIGTVDKIIYEYFGKVSAFTKKLSKEKFIAVFTQKDLELFSKDQFSGLVEEIKKIDVGYGKMPVTVSVGVGAGEKKFNETYELAKSALFLALGRGGDQAVVKNGNHVDYYGGKIQQVEKNARVKVRVKAEALKRTIFESSKVIVMGHKNIDIDAFGACVGIYEVARNLGKPAHIVLGSVTSGIEPFYERFVGREEYTGHVFISPREALEEVNDQTVVVVVDVNRPCLTECPELIDSKKGALVVFDHHRTSNDDIKGADLSYVDTFASSTCEMVTEMIQYIDMDIELMGFESDALLGGIVVDTDGFKSKTGPRTFEAAAFLRRHGADVIRVRKLLRSQMAEYRAVTEAASKADIMDNGIAISRFDGTGLANPAIACAKAANQLMNIKGVRASFVLTMYNGNVSISARSLDDINVQRIMEKLGGGGHLSIAGAQLSGVTIDQAEDLLRKTIDLMFKKGEI